MISFIGLKVVILDFQLPIHRDPNIKIFIVTTMESESLAMRLLESGGTRIYN